MFDSVFNNIIFLIPLAIFIGRAVVNSRNKNKPKPREEFSPPYYEDEKDDFIGKIESEIMSEVKAEAKKEKPAPSRDEPQYFRALGFPGTQSSAKPLPSKNLSVKNSLHGSSVGNLAAAMSIKDKPPEDASLPKRGAHLNLARLSPLKQAVVMAEILGPPKGLQ